VIILKLEFKEVKKEVMKKKYRLKGNKIFIENDLSWKERKIQEKINRWAKEQRGKELNVKIGLGRVKVKRLWRSWMEVEREEKKKNNREKRQGRR